ncbi:MAG: hypothetical protein Alpg2KO_15270 [Alphaproteobacteria bacterium]
MKSLFTRLFLAAALALPVTAVSTFAAAPVHANAPVILVVDLDKVMVKSKAVGSIRSQFEKELESAKSRFKPEQEKLAAEEKELLRKRTILSPEAFNQQVTELRGQIASFGKDLREREVKIRQAMDKALTTFRKSAVGVVGEIAEQREADLVLPNSGVVLVSPELDITDEVIKRLDRKTPDVRVNFDR